MRRIISTILAAALCLSLPGISVLAAVANPDSSAPSDAYKMLTAFKTADYEQQSVADFNRSLIPENGDLSELLDAQAEVLTSISSDDENYEFITATIAASLEELYCEQMQDQPGFSVYLKRAERSKEELPDENPFVFTALYSLYYTISDPTKLTIAERDSAFQEFQAEYQDYVDDLSEADLAGTDIRNVLCKKADELANKFSITEMELSCELESMEIHNAGSETVWD